MDRRWLLWLATAAATVASGCASGDGAPEARVVNGFQEGCIVEASFLGYHFTAPVAPTGIMASREVYEGSDKAYAVVLPLPTADLNGDKVINCYDTVLQDRGTLWVTNKAYTAQAGQVTNIAFKQPADAANPQPDEATSIAPDCNDATFVKGVTMFARLAPYCATTP